MTYASRRERFPRMDFCYCPLASIFPKSFFYSTAMPTYDYICNSCGHEMEAFQSMKDAPLTDCPSCGEPALRRRIGAGAGLIFKGSGFYITDYKKDAKPSGKDSASGAKAASTEKKSSTPGKSGDSVGSSVSKTPVPAS